MLLGIFSVSAASYAQSAKLSLDMQDVTLYDVVFEIEKQSEFMFFYKSGDIDDNMKVSIQAKDKTITEILNEVTENADLTYVVDNKHVLTAKKSSASLQQIQVTGTVMENDEPLPGVNVSVKGTTTGIMTDSDGKYSL
jgi:hypothetical protein